MLPLAWWFILALVAVAILLCASIPRETSESISPRRGKRVHWNPIVTVIGYFKSPKLVTV